MDDVVTNSEGRRFRVKLVRKGDHWGRSGSLVHDRHDPMVQFWDLTHAGERTFGGDGQMASSYYLSTLLAIPAGRGLDLDGGIAVWYLDAAAIDHTFRVISAIYAELITPTDVPTI